jgi:hypothetical protein
MKNDVFWALVRFLQAPHGVTSQMTSFFIGFLVSTAVQFLLGYDVM